MTSNLASDIHYKITLDKVKSHCFSVELTIPAHSQNELILSLPSWIAGSYMIRDFAKNITHISASQNNNPVALQKIDKQSWKVQTNQQALQVKYQVYAFDTSVRTAYLDQTRGFFNGTSLFLQVSGFEQSCHQVTLVKPDSLNWKVATGLKRLTGTNKYQFGDYYADDYAELIDCPVELADFTEVEFDVYGVPHHLILSGKQYADLPRVKADLTKICRHHIDLFEKETGGKPPFSEYWFLTNILPNQFGGLEHKNSTALLCSNFDFPNPNFPDTLSDDYQTFLSLASHEYFHSWNVCRIKPKPFIPYDLTQESYTEQLWAYEGITSYYDDLSLYRTGIISQEKYLTVLAKTYSRVNRGKGQLKQTVAESSFYTWNKFYKQGEDAVNNIVSYYAKGCLVALWMDLTIRVETQGQKSLDDFMRILWTRHGQTQIGTTEQSFIDILNEVTAKDLTQDLTHLLHSAEKVDLTELFKKVGINQSYQPVQLKDALSVDDSTHNPYLGIIYKAHPQGVQVMVVLEDSPAEKAGINPKDILLAIDGWQLEAAQLPDLCANLMLNQSYPLHLFRDKQLFSLQLSLTESPKLAVQLTQTDKDKTQLWPVII